MLSKLIALYTAAQTQGTTSPMPHLFGPPGTGKSSVVKQLADLAGVRLHTVNVSRLSPLELEGVQVPNKDASELNMLYSSLWTALKPGDIILWDEYLRGFPEVYNGILDILTSRHVAGLDLPPVFMVGASNSTVAYDPALDDRLLHIPVPDIRKNNAAYNDMLERFITEASLMPHEDVTDVVSAWFQVYVTPGYRVLDELSRKPQAGSDITEYISPRKAAGMVQLRKFPSSLNQVVNVSNSFARLAARPERFIVHDQESAPTFKELTQDGVPSSLMDSFSEIEYKNFHTNVALLKLYESEPKESE